MRELPKLAGEGLITSFSHLFGFDYYIYRFANVAGKSLTHGVIHKLICQLNNGNNLELLSDGTPKKGYRRGGLRKCHAACL